MRIIIPKEETNNVLPVLQFITFAALILYFGRALWIPLSFAALISFILYPICKYLEEKGIRKLAAVIMSLMLIVLLGTAAIALLIQQFGTFVKEWPTIQVKLHEAFDSLSLFLSDQLGLSSTQQKIWIEKMSSDSPGTAFDLIRRFATSSGAYIVLLILIPVFSALMLYYRRLLVDVLYKLFPRERKDRITRILTLTIKAYYNFIKGMLMVYLIVGILNSIGLLLLGVPHAIFFGFVAAILTFIPYVGIIVGSLLPITMSWITYNSIWYPIGVVLIFAFVQYLEANVIFPITVSRRLNINALATLVAILAGGILWGVSGMILFVPFLAILKLIADHNPRMKTLAMLIGTGSDY